MDDSDSPFVGAIYGAPVLDEDTFRVILADTGPRRLAVMSMLRQRLGLSLQAIRALVAELPVVLQEGAEDIEASALRAALERLGAQVVVEPED